MQTLNKEKKHVHFISLIVALKQRTQCKLRNMYVNCLVIISIANGSSVSIGIPRKLDALHSFRSSLKLVTEENKNIALCRSRNDFELYNRYLHRESSMKSNMYLQTSKPEPILWTSKLTQQQISIDLASQHNTITEKYDPEVLKISVEFVHNRKIQNLEEG